MKDLQQLMDLTGRVALVTGGAGHIGSVAGETLAELGASVILVDLAEEGVTLAAERIAVGRRGLAIPVAGDLADETTLRGVADRIGREFGRLDVLVNCAALVGTSSLRGWVAPFGEQLPETWRLALEVNLTVPFALTQACLGLMRTASRASVVNVSSIYGMVGPVNQIYEGTPLGVPAAYAASKGGLAQFTRWLATALAPEVRANSISLGGVWRGQPEAFVRRYKERTPLGRMAREQDIKGAIAYLASDLSEYVTGHNLVVDGGWTAW